MSSALTARTAEVLPARSLFGHPPGLTVLFMTQMWAEFSYFGLQALLVYYMTQHLGFSQAKSSLIFGTYGAAAFFSPFLGGIVADRFLGRTKSVLIGGTMMMCGHFAMVSEQLLLPALGLVALGNGLFLPPLAVQVGSLYADDDPRKSHAFSAYYMGINLGGFLAPLVCGSLGEFLGWHWGFAAAGIGMLAGLIIYRGFAALLPPEAPSMAKAARETRPALSAVERDQLRALASIVAVVVLFRIAYEQSGNVIALWVSQQTDRHIIFFGQHAVIPATWFQAINPLLIIMLTPVLIAIWGRRERRRGGANLLHRMSLGCAFSGLSLVVMMIAAALYARTAQPVGPEWVILYFVLLTLGELMVIPVGLTMVSALAPARMASMAMGAWYIAKFLGSLLAGAMGAYWGLIPPIHFFGLGAASVLIAGVMLYWMGRGKEDVLF